MRFSIIAFLIAVLISLISCKSVHKDLSTHDIMPVENFELERYMGTWYEIARLNHKFEKFLDNVSATYTLDKDGDIYVLNKGYHIGEQQWKEAEGKAKIPDLKNPSNLKVSFFLFFYSTYKIIAIDENYQWAVVTTDSKEHLWILSRKPEMEEEQYGQLLKFAKENGYMSNLLIRVKQDKNIEALNNNK